MKTQTKLQKITQKKLKQIKKERLMKRLKTIKLMLLSLIIKFEVFT
jgi:hypothetical protein